MLTEDLNDMLCSCASNRMIFMV